MTSLRGVLTPSIVAAALSAASGQWCADPTDKVLCAARLTDEEVAQFDPNNKSAVSAFWSNWAGRDQIELVAPRDCYPGRCNFRGVDDARVTVRAGATNDGLYLYIAAEDNAWVDPKNPGDITSDCVDFCFDKLSSEEIRTCTDCLQQLHGTSLTTSSMEIQVKMAATALPSGFNLYYYDLDYYCFGSSCANGNWWVEWGEAPTRWGIQAKIMGVDGTHKVQEWFFPWTSYGGQGRNEGGFCVGRDLSRKKLAFSGGYNDVDGSDPVCSLRWVGKDPWVGLDETPPAYYWGDIQLPDGMVVYDMSMCDVTRDCPCREGIGYHRAARRLAARDAVARADFYTLRGERVDGSKPGRVPAGGVVLKRTTLASGESLTEAILRRGR